MKFKCLINVIALLLFFAVSRSAFSNPQGMTVQSGTATTATSGSTLTITAADNARLNWQSFNIASGEQTVFQQQSSSSIVWNTIGGQSASQIYGSLQANGIVVLMNSSGFYFGSDSYVKAAGLVVSTAAGAPVETSTGTSWQFSGPPTAAQIVNYGRISADTGGFVYLLGASIDNKGAITAPGGNIGLCAGQTVLLSERSDGRGLSAKVTLPTGTINNSGQLVADAGTILASAQVINQNGLIQADSVKTANGIVELFASDSVNFGANSEFSGCSQIDAQAGNNITIAANTHWNLDAGDMTSSGSLKLEAGNDITLKTASSIIASDGWSLTLEAGRNFSSENTVTGGTGSITLSGSAGIQTGSGNISLLAGNSITVNSGYVRTVNSGSIDVNAVSGTVKTGTNPNGFDFRSTGTGYVVDSDLGGISTANGGNVTINAGTDIISYLPVAGGVQTDAGSGCFGSAAGNVTLTAGRDVLGHYVAVNGTGTINAGRNAGSASKPLALSLVSGGWNVKAANDILLQEVRNPNGIFNDLGSASSSLRHYFDYSADAYTILTAGNSVKLLGSALPRYEDSFESSIPCIYPPTLEISSGAGGVALGGDLILFPSAQGWLSIATSGGGSFASLKSGSDLAQIILSDSGKNQYLESGDFGINDHASAPVHLNDNRSLELNISGDMENIYVVSAEKASINVGGDMVNCRFDGQNLHANDVTSINVAGAIKNRSEFTSVTLSTTPDYTVLENAFPPLSGNLAAAASLFYYDASAKMLTFQGRMSSALLQALLDLTVQVYDSNGQPVLDSAGNPVTISAQFVSAETLKYLYAASQDIAGDPSSGYRIGGAGLFNISAASMDLGTTAGIVSEGPAENAVLANYFTKGASINLKLTGNLDMFSTTISCLNGGDINVFAGGSINLGSAYFTGNDDFARGIFSTCNSGVTVIAGGNITINGSRIAAYDGGNVTVRSLYGNIAIGSGSQGSASVEEFYVNPVTRTISSYTVAIPGSGILATTFPKSLNASFPTSINTVGDILVETPEGNITASSAGIVQTPLNGSSARSGNVTLNAGTQDANGHVLYVGNIDVSGSGVIGGSVHLNATGNIKGAIVARNRLDISALQNVAVSAFAAGNSFVSAGETLSGTLIGGGELNVDAGTIGASLLSQNINVSGTVATSQIGFSVGATANATSQSQSEDFSAKTLAQADEPNSIDKKKTQEKERNPRLKQSAGRVTILTAH